MCAGCYHIIQQVVAITRTTLEADLPNVAIKLETLQKDLYKEQVKGQIYSSTSSVSAPVIFIKKADGSLHLCVDYHSLNAITKKNQYLLPCIDKLMNWVTSTTFFTKLNLHDTYHHIRICEEDKWKIAFHIQYSYFEYLVMPFGLTNMLAAFQYLSRAGSSSQIG